jgi:NADPH:quinone reductase-like Zn-dependent oxidoreductase
MKAIGYTQSLPISDPLSLIDIELKQPAAAGYDLLVRINAIAVNPVDCKIRQNVSPEGDEYKIIGWDAVGEVAAIGGSVSNFNPGDRVFYAGDLIGRAVMPNIK